MPPYYYSLIKVVGNAISSQPDSMWSLDDAKAVLVASLVELPFFDSLGLESGLASWD